MLTSEQIAESERLDSEIGPRPDCRLQRLSPYRPPAPHDRTVFYLNDEEAEVVRNMRKAVQAQRELNRKRSAGEDDSGDSQCQK